MVQDHSSFSGLWHLDSHRLGLNPPLSVKPSHCEFHHIISPWIAIRWLVHILIFFVHCKSMIHRKGPWLYVKSCGTHWCSFFSHGLECFSGESNGSPLKGIASSGNSKESPAASAIDTIGVFSLDFGCAHQTMAQRRGETYLPLLHTCVSYNMTCQCHSVVNSGAKRTNPEVYILRRFWIRETFHIEISYRDLARIPLMETSYREIA